ncbi:TfoX/Sxy family DNA transformation protein [Thioclava pacifica]|uniref:TfoX C-terminal domain-containing protein n=1 Tax=Thioclava pacifica DSM 10166 TaxID=1353537 RepID=A0A074JJ03_9RHOB|nr:TfoX/Sxy family DNA transformation protein [Thioclava pacifica]KEO56469.1 hypothetical protein TP2_02780 [Thioclava pacifica DSM 10166]
MASPLTSIKGIGPAIAEGFARAGITSAEELRAIGAEAAYEVWLASGNPPHFIGYYALHMALQGRPWNDCRGAEKEAFRVKFDALKARVAAQGANTAPSKEKGRARLDAALDEIGLREKR